MHERTFQFFDLINLFKEQKSEKIGFYFSFFIHLIFFILVIGFPNFFKSSPINIPTIIPIEIINVSDITSIHEESEPAQEKTIEKKILEQKKFSNAKSQLIKKPEIKSKPKTKSEKSEEVSKVKETKIQIEEDSKNLIEKDNDILKEKDQVKIESLPTKKIKPKIKPKPKNATILNQQNSDIKVQIQPKPEPEQGFNIASMLKDLRNDQRSLQKKNIEIQKKEDQKILNKNENNDKPEEKATLSISEIDLLYQQLRMCWSAPAGATINKDMKIKISAKIKPDRHVLDGSVRIIDTNIPKSNRFYYVITESALRTLMNPKCNPLKLPEDKYDLWKNLTITFDHSNMKG